jgi:hypothetical protein
MSVVCLEKVNGLAMSVVAMSSDTDTDECSGDEY